MSLKPEFNEDSGWQPIDDQQIYSPEELRAYEQQRQHEIEQMMKEGKVTEFLAVLPVHRAIVLALQDFRALGFTFASKEKTDKLLCL